MTLHPRHYSSIAMLTLVWLMTMLPHKGQAQYHYNFNETCQKAYHQILCLQLDSARVSLQQETRQHPHNLLPQLLHNYTDVLYLVLTEDKAYFEKIKDRKKTRLRLWDKGPEDSPWHLSGEAQIKLQWAFARVLFNEYVTAATEINSAYHLLEKNQKKYPSFLIDNMGIGILHAMIGVIPDQYQWALKLFGFYGTIEQGMHEVQLQVKANKPQKNLSAEALFYYTFLKMNLQNDTNRLKQIIQLFEQAPFDSLQQTSPVLHFAYCNTLLRYNNDSAIIALQHNPHQAGALHFYYLDLLLGQALVYKNDPKAVAHLKKYVQKYPGHNYKKVALQRLAWYYFMQNDTLGYQGCMLQIDELPSTVLDGDKSAQKESEAAAKGELPNLHLLRSRLLFDGHYYHKALQALSPLATQHTNKATQLEYYYRKGRIEDEMGHKTQALQSYATAISYGQESTRYFAGRAALESGAIYETQGKKGKALEAYEQCLSLPFSEYRQGIRAKAKAGLQRCK